MTDTLQTNDDFDAYLQYLSLDEHKILINGDKKYPITLPRPINKQTIENSVYESCQRYNIDYVSTENVIKWSSEMVKQYYLQNLQSRRDVASAPQPVQLTEELTKDVTFKEIGAILSTSIKKDYSPKLITFCAMLLVQTREDQLNIGFQSESSAGKSYIPVELASYFPKDEVSIIASASPTAFFHDSGKWDKDRQVLVVDIEGKILIFLDQPHFQLLEKLRPLLSHDMKELQYKITDKNQKHGLRTKNVIIKGYPSVVFCSTKMDPDEQEKTRMILLSPSIDQDKLKESIMLMSLRKGNPDEYSRLIRQDPGRTWLINRIRAIRQWGVKEVIIPNHEKDVCERFLKGHRYLVPRHQRDFPRIFSLIKAHALLNCFHRDELKNGQADQPHAILATQKDIDAGFELYQEVELSNELGLSPYIFRIFSEVFAPLLKPESGITREEILKQYYAVFHKTLSPETLKKEIIPQLDTVGLITQEPDPGDKRRLLIYPTISTPIISVRIAENKQDSSKNGENSRGEDGGVKVTLDSVMEGNG